MSGETTTAMRPAVARMLRIAIAVVGVLLIAASRLPWFSVDVEARQIVDTYLLSDDVMRSLIGYRVGSDRLILLVLGILIAITAGLWAWRVGLLLARPLLLTFSGVGIAWSTLAFFDVNTVPSESNATEGMTASMGPMVCLALSIAVLVLTLLARVAASDIAPLSVQIMRLLGRGRTPIAAVLSRRMLRAAERDLGSDHPDTMRAAIAHAECLVLAGFPDLASRVLTRVEARPELERYAEVAASAGSLRRELADIVGDDGTLRPDFMGR